MFDQMLTTQAARLTGIFALVCLLSGIGALAGTALPAPTGPTAEVPAQVDCADESAGTDDCELVEVTCYREEKVQRCRTVIEKKPVKKIVYDCKEVPYCLHRRPRFLQRASEAPSDRCPDCEDCPRYRRVLLRREIVVGEKSVEKCVVYDDVQWVPYVELRRVPRRVETSNVPAVAPPAETVKSTPRP